MHILANISLVFAALLYLVPLQLLLASTRKKKEDGSGVWSALFVLIPLWICVAVALLVSVHRDAFDWLGFSRPSQYLVLTISLLSLTVVSFSSFLGRVEHPNHLPCSVRPFFGWGLHGLTAGAIASATLFLNPQLAPSIVPLAYRLPFAILCSASVLTCLAMLAEWFAYSQRLQSARVQQAHRRDNERDQTIFARVQSLDPVKDFADLLGFTNRFEVPRIRELALAKAQSHPRFRDALAEVLESWRAESAMVYLDACEVSAADREALAPSVHRAIEELQKQVEDSVERTHTFHADQFLWTTRLILSVAQKFQSQELDYTTAIRAFRSAMNSQRTRAVPLQARTELDRWLGTPSNTLRP